jgi:hypothetical protein
MDVVPALGQFEGRIHRLNVQSAVGQLRVTSGARCPSFLAVSLMAGETTEAFMNAHWRSVVSRANVSRNQRGMALIAERLAHVGTDPERPISIVERWKR